jgi:tetraacyldisaccharide 4'-kinase
MGSISNVMLPPLSALYRAVTQIRLAAYNRGFFTTTRLAVPVISIGNLTTGGTGKTPLVEWVCRTLARRQKKVCILTRGYGRPNANSRVIVSDGSKVLTNAQEAGDEPFMLAQNLKGLSAVISDPNRIAAGQWAIENLGVEVFVLDDGFQHLALARDLDILTIDAANPWGGGMLLPAGRLREPRSGLSRADCVVVTRSDQTDELASLRADIQRLIGSGPIVISEMKVKHISRLNTEQPEELLSLPLPAVAFCALGNPESFFEQLRRAGIEPLFTRTFPDHHQYTQTDVDALIREAGKRGVLSLITTAKDAVKLNQCQFELPCYVLHIEISFTEEETISQMVWAAAGA